MSDTATKPPSDQQHAATERFSPEHGPAPSERAPSATDVVRRMYAAFRARDYDAFAALCTPDIQWIQNEGFPGGASRVGPRAVFDHVFTANAKRWADFAYEIEQFLEAGDTVLVIGQYSGKSQSSGMLFRAAAAHLYDVRGGLIARYRQFADTHVLWRHAGTGVGNADVSADPSSG